MTPSSTISGIPPTFDATTGRDSAIASRIVRPCASRYDGRTATSSAAVTAGTSSRRPVNTTRWAIRSSARLRLELVAPAALADDQQVGVGDGAEDAGPRLEQRRVALLGLQPRDDADDLRARLHPVFLGERAARLLVVVALEVDAVVDEADRDASSRPSSSSLVSLAFETAISWSNVRRQLEQGRPVRLGADPARVGRRDQVRPPLAGLAERDDRPCRHRLGAVHVGVDDVGADLGQVGRERTDGDRVIRARR